MSYILDRCSSCSSLQHLNISSFNICNITGMTSVFKFCSSLQELNICLKYQRYKIYKKINFYNISTYAHKKMESGIYKDMPKIIMIII